MNGPVFRSTPHRRAGRRSAAAAFAALAVIALAACGSDEADGDAAGVTTETAGAETASTETASTETTGTETASTETASTETAKTEPESTETTSIDGSGGEVAGPVSTVPADLPEQLVGQIGALDVTGDSLPAFGGDTAADPAIGAAAPVLVGTDFAGNAVRVDAATDGPTMLVFLAHWCPHCNAEVPVLNGLRDAGGFPDDLNVIAVSTAVSPDRPNFPPSEWMKDVDWTYPVIADGVDMAAGTFIGPTVYGLDGFPFTVLIDADGNVAARWSGASTADEITKNIATYLD